MMGRNGFHFSSYRGGNGSSERLTTRPDGRDRSDSRSQGLDRDPCCFALLLFTLQGEKVILVGPTTCSVNVREHSSPHPVCGLLPMFLPCSDSATALRGGPGLTRESHFPESSRWGGDGRRFEGQGQQGFQPPVPRSLSTHEKPQHLPLKVRSAFMSTAAWSLER